MDASVRERGLAVWRRVLALSWPVMVQHVFRTLMRTTDILVTGFFSPAAVAAVGLADLYARLPLQIGLGFGVGAIALSSQDTAGEAVANRDEAVTQAFVFGAVTGIPFAVFGLLFGEQAIALLGAPEDVAQMGGTYLTIILLSAPARHVALIGARALQGTGNTKTPMYIDVVSSLLNIVGSVVLGLGLFGFPQLGIVGVGAATAVGNSVTALALTGAVASSRTVVSFRFPSDIVIAKQLLAVSVPKVVEGFVSTAAEFPFNALLLGFGTEFNAAYQIGRRASQQVTSPLARGYYTASSILVGQSLGRDDADGARFQGWATAALALVTVGGVGIALVIGAGEFATLFTDDATTMRYATGFTRAFGLAAPALAVYLVFAGALQGGSDSRTPFLARTTGLFGFLLGFSYLASVVLGWGVVGVYAGVALQWVWALVVVAWGFARGDWASKAAEMMDARGSGESGDTEVSSEPTD